MRSAEIYMHGHKAGMLWQDEEGYHFAYAADYCSSPHASSVSVTLPVRTTPYFSRVLFSFFDGLIPEGWLLHIAERNWKLNPRDRMGLLLVCCEDCIGAVSVIRFDGEEHSENDTEHNEE
jgi:serine/threonine-protein kinase HipA